MARSRNLKPGYFTNDVLCALQPLARILFAGLWTLCDREGRCEDRPRKIKAELLPYDDCDPEALLQLLCEAGFIDRYDAGGMKVIQVVKWHKHQNPHVKESPSTLPVRCESGAGPVQEPDEAQPEPERAGLIPSLLIPSLLIPDSLNTAAAVRAEADDRFDRFWTQYPRKSAKKDAQKAFTKLAVSEALLTKILNALATQRRSTAWAKNSGEFIPLPATWLNGERWEDGSALAPSRTTTFAETRDYGTGVTSDGTFTA